MARVHGPCACVRVPLSRGSGADIPCLARCITLRDLQPKSLLVPRDQSAWTMHQRVHRGGSGRLQDAEKAQQNKACSCRAGAPGRRARLHSVSNALFQQF